MKLAAPAQLKVKLPSVSEVLRSQSFYYRKDLPELPEFFDFGAVVESLGGTRIPGLTAALQDWMRLRCGDLITQLQFQPRLINRAAGYSGRPGAMVTVIPRGDISLAIFTDKPTISPVHAVRLGAYACSLGSGEGLPHGVKCEVVELRRDGKCAPRQIQLADVLEGYNVFISALNVHRWRERHGRL